LELNWSTFVLEMINFLVLVWILKRFLYQPVLDVIAARRKSIEDRLAEAHRIEQEAGQLREQYAGRLSDWETERRQARDELTREIDGERARQQAELRAALEQEREKARVADERRQSGQRRAVEQQALRLGAAFSSRLLEQAAGPELEARLLQMAVDGLQGLPAEQRSRLREQWTDASQPIDVSSAFPLSDAQRDSLTAALLGLAGRSDIRFRQDAGLVAGLRVEIGAWVLAANVRDELQGFTELAGAPG